MARFLLVCHDAGGTVPPMVALAEALVARGHAVSMLSQPSVRVRAAAAGCELEAFSQLGDYDPTARLEDQLEVTVPMVSGPSVGDDLVRVARAAGADALVVDANLAGALAAAESLPQPSAVLLHSMYKTFVDVWFSEVWPLLESEVNRSRAAFGLDPATSWSALFAGHDRLVSVVPAAFDAPVAEVPTAMRHFGFLAPRTAPAFAPVDLPPGDAPAVLVSLSTTKLEQERLLPVILGALGRLDVRALVTTAGQVDAATLQPPRGVVVVDYVPHASVLDRADAMVTHAGLGTVAAALEVGVPLVCTPISRDQPLNAERVADLGAGVRLDSDPGEQELADALELVLAQPGYRNAARSLAAASRAAGGAPAAAADLEALLG